MELCISYVDKLCGVMRMYAHNLNFKQMGDIWSKMDETLNSALTFHLTNNIQSVIL